jgi:hypothetical protein
MNTTSNLRLELILVREVHYVCAVIWIIHGYSDCTMLLALLSYT